MEGQKQLVSYMKAFAIDLVAKNIFKRRVSAYHEDKDNIIFHLNKKKSM